MRFRTLEVVIIGSLAAFPFACCQSSAATLTLNPIADTTLFETTPDNNLGGSSLAAGATAGRTGAPERARALVKFSFTNLPPNAVISSAQISFVAFKGPGGAVNSTFELRRVLVDWAEGTKLGKTGQPASDGETTWNDRFFGTTPWSSPGGAIGEDFANNISATKLLSLNTMTFASTQALIDDIKFWLANTNANFGWVLRSQSEGTARTARRFGNKERDSGSTPASLVITYTVPSSSPPTITTQPSSVVAFPGETATFNVAATISGGGALSYQWLRGATAITGATNTSLVLTNVQTADAASYSVTVSSGGISTNSSSAQLTIASAPKFESIGLAGTNVNLTFNTQPGHTYAVESTPVIAPAAWTALTNYPSISQTNAVTLTVGRTGTQSFFRLAVKPSP